VVEDDAINHRAPALQACCSAFVRTIDLNVVCEFPLAFGAMPEGLAVALIAVSIAMMLEQTSAVLRERDDVLARARQPHRLNESLLPKMSQIARAWIERPVVLVAEITTGDHPKGTDGRESPRLGSSERVLAISNASDLALRSARQVQVSCEDLARVVPAVSLGPTRIVARIVTILVRFSRISGTASTDIACIVISVGSAIVIGIVIEVVGSGAFAGNVEALHVGRRGGVAIDATVDEFGLRSFGAAVNLSDS